MRERERGKGGGRKNKTRDCGSLSFSLRSVSCASFSRSCLLWAPRVRTRVFHNCSAALRGAKGGARPARVVAVLVVVVVVSFSLLLSLPWSIVAIPSPPSRQTAPLLSLFLRRPSHKAEGHKAENERRPCAAGAVFLSCAAAARLPAARGGRSCTARSAPGATLLSPSQGRERSALAGGLGARTFSPAFLSLSPSLRPSPLLSVTYALSASI